MPNKILTTMWTQQINIPYELIEKITLGILFLFLLIFLIEIFLILYHLLRFGIGTRPKQFGIFFLLGSGFFILAAGIITSSLIT